MSKLSFLMMIMLLQGAFLYGENAFQRGAYYGGQQYWPRHQTYMQENMSKSFYNDSSGELHIFDLTKERQFNERSSVYQADTYLNEQAGKNFHNFYFDSERLGGFVRAKDNGANYFQGRVFESHVFSKNEERSSYEKMRLYKEDRSFRDINAGRMTRDKFFSEEDF